MEENKKKKLKKTLLTCLLIGGCYLGYKIYQYVEMQNLIKNGIVSPEPTLEAVDQKTFEELPVGVIYEVPEELQNQYLNSAKAKYEKYKDLGPQQTATDLWNPDHYATEREDVVVRGNKKPSDMLNDDMSLRYPDMFFGFIIHDENITGSRSEVWESYATNQPNLDFRYDGAMADKMNQIFYVEDQYLNGGINFAKAYGKNKEDLGDFYKTQLNDANVNAPHNPVLQSVVRGIESGFYGDNSNKDVKTLFSYMYMSGNPSLDQYDTAYHYMNNSYSSYYYNEVTKIDLLPEKYNDVKNLDDTCPVYFYPTKVWKIDNNTIVVDINVVNGDRMTFDDITEILTKFHQANRAYDEIILMNDESRPIDDFIPYIELEDDTYLVLGRFFDAEGITNGIMPEYGTFVLNYQKIGDWYNGTTTYNERGLFVFNKKAKEFLSEFYDILEEELNNNGKPSTQKMIKQAAKKVGISYQDGLNIYATHYSLSTMNNNSSVQWQ